ncbi:unnamed protein product, partial [marine sediment metagenome]
MKLHFGSRGRISPTDLVFLEVKVPRESEETPESMVSFLASLSHLLRGSSLLKRLGGKKPSLSLEIAAFDQAIHFYLAMPQAEQGYVESQVQSQYPKALLLPSPDYMAGWREQPVAFGHLAYGAPSYYPLRTYVDFKDVDPLSSVLGVLSKAKEGEKLAIQLVLSKASSGWARAGRRALAGTTDSEGNVTKPEDADIIDSKISQPGYEVCMRIIASAPTGQQAASLVSNLSSAYGAFAHGEGNVLRFTAPKAWQRQNFLKAIFERRRAYCPRNQVFSLSEIASLYHFPSIILATSGVSWGA